MSRKARVCSAPTDDNRVYQDVEGHWWVCKPVQHPPEGHKGQWTGWISEPISKKKALRTIMIQYHKSVDNYQPKKPMTMSEIISKAFHRKKI